MALVQAPGSPHRDPLAPGCLECELGGADRACEQRGVDDVREEVGRCEQLAGVNGFVGAALGETDVDPAGEEALLVPDALAVAEQEKPVGGCAGHHEVGALGMTATPGSSLPSSSSSEAPPPVDAHETSSSEAELVECAERVCAADDRVRIRAAQRLPPLPSCRRRTGAIRRRPSGRSRRSFAQCRARRRTGRVSAVRCRARSSRRAARRRCRCARLRRRRSGLRRRRRRAARQETRAGLPPAAARPSSRRRGRCLRARRDVAARRACRRPWRRRRRARTAVRPRPEADRDARARFRAAGPRRSGEAGRLRRSRRAHGEPSRRRPGRTDRCRRPASGRRRDRCSSHRRRSACFRARSGGR